MSERSRRQIPGAAEVFGRTKTRAKCKNERQWDLRPGLTNNGTKELKDGNI